MHSVIDLVSWVDQKRLESSANQNSRQHPSCKRTAAPLDTRCKHTPFDKHCKRTDAPLDTHCKHAPFDKHSAFVVLSKTRYVAQVVPYR